MKLIITAGGGGHFAPALSVIKNLPKGTDVLVIGRKYAFEGDKTVSLEYRTAQAMKIPFESITTARLQRSFTRHTIPSIAKLPIGYMQARKMIKEFRPDVILSFGGYVAVPVTLAARSLGVPVVIHEQTLGAGLANKIAARFATKICLSWKNSLPYFPENKSIITGNPLRDEILTASEKDSPIQIEKNAPPLIYITGGSLGSHAINMIVKESVPELVKSFTIFHQTGDAQEFNDYNALCEVRDNLQKEYRDRYILTKFVNPQSVGALIRSADLVVSRAGINTVSELIYLNTPGLLIPLPHGQSNEQLTNARFFENLGLGKVCEQGALTSHNFVRTVREMLDNAGQYSLAKEKRNELIHEDAAARIIEVVVDVAKEKNGKTTD